MYRGWPETILPEVEICAVRLPGHEGRFIEEPYRRMSKLVEDLTSEIFPLLNRPFLFFGHSIGAHISFHLARYLRKNCMPGPIHMFVSGSRAPHIPDGPDDLHYKMQKDVFIKKINRVGRYGRGNSAKPGIDGFIFTHIEGGYRGAKYD